ncbi:hypothetical protein QMK19_09080 [Streptomyces sp. H10-C2]|uniref:hypothetical protein n=1 Tax=unclassified Streptomyces TaxID=2593676 RepID=UPI0024B93DFF|nr:MULTISPECIES: hypothetical protein [unclassified Streptomyces]MDJ0340941.1 hypothetical protein [Streptomyces sp. PH10-H1]MDJ0369827.1 hypothetical protein [Streptomyces sp. H10-C2]
MLKAPVLWGVRAVRGPVVRASGKRQALGDAQLPVAGGCSVPPVAGGLAVEPGADAVRPGPAAAVPPAVSGPVPVAADAPGAQVIALSGQAATECSPTPERDA